MRQAFHLDEEDLRFRDHYGRTKQGQSVVLARRLIEAGVRFVTVHDGQYNGQLANWDAHADVFNRLKDVLFPPPDPVSSGSSGCIAIFKMTAIG